MSCYSATATYTFGICGIALAWFESYLSGRSYCVVVDSVMSQVIQVLCSVPQGSVLGPLLSLLYTAELAELAARFGVTLHAFADDNQLYLSCRTNDAHLSVAPLERCVTAISQWMSANRLKLNMEKTEWLWTGSRSNLDPVKLTDFPRAHCNWYLVTIKSTSLMQYGFLEYSSRRICVLTSTSPPLVRSVSSSYVSCAESDAHSMMSL